MTFFDLVMAREMRRVEALGNYGYTMQRRDFDQADEKDTIISKLRGGWRMSLCETEEAERRGEDLKRRVDPDVA